MKNNLIKGKIYKEIDYEEVLSHHNSNGTIFYHIFYGEVDWHKDGQNRKAICIFMRYGDRINFRTPANILLEDLNAVEECIDKLKSRNNIN